MVTPMRMLMWSGAMASAKGDTAPQEVLSNDGDGCQQTVRVGLGFGDQGLLTCRCNSMHDLFALS